MCHMSTQSKHDQSPTFSPLYRQVIGLITRNLESGEWKPGESIPSEARLAVQFGVSQGTVRKAIDEMVADNLLIRRQGKGTFVATHADPLALFRFVRIAANEGALGELRSRALGCWRVKASVDVARALHLPTGAPVMMLRRIVDSGDSPAIFDEIYLPGAAFADLTLDMLQFDEISLYSLYESRFGVRVVRADERVRATLADPVSAELLDVAEKSPLVLVERMTYTYGDKPVEWRRGVFSALRYHYKNQLA